MSSPLTKTSKCLPYGRNFLLNEFWLCLLLKAAFLSHQLSYWSKNSMFGIVHCRRRGLPMVHHLPSKQVLLHGMLGGGWGVGGEMFGGGSDLVRDVWPQAGLTSPNSPIQLWSQTKRHIHTYIRANSHRHTHPLESHFVWFFGSMVTSQDNPLQRWRGIRWKVVRAALDKKPILCTGLTSGKEGIVGRPPCVSVPPLSPAWLMASLPPQLSMKCLSTGKACIRC